jgi:hypothetical protein
MDALDQRRRSAPSSRPSSVKADERERFLLLVTAR